MRAHSFSVFGVHGCFIITVFTLNQLVYRNVSRICTSIYGDGDVYIIHVERDFLHLLKYHEAKGERVNEREVVLAE